MAISIVPTIFGIPIRTLTFRGYYEAPIVLGRYFVGGLMAGSVKG